MAQKKNLLSFRARLRSRGYSDVCIKRCISLEGIWMADDFGQMLYYVTCKEPLLGKSVQFVCSEPQMNNWPGIPFERCGYFNNSEQMEIDEYGGIFV